MPPRPAAEVAPPIGGGRPRVRCALHVHTNVEIVNYIHIYILFKISTYAHEKQTVEPY